MFTATTVDISAAASEEAARRIAARALPHVPELVRELVEGEFRATSPFGELPDDVREVELARTTGIALRDFLTRAAAGAPQLPPEPAPFTERAAQRAEESVPLDAVVRTYLSGGRHLMRALRAHAGPGELSGLPLLTERLLTVLEEMIAGVIGAYVTEYEELRADGRAARQVLARALVEGRSIGTLADELGLTLADRYVVLSLHIGAPDAGQDGTDPARRMLWRRRLRRVRAELGRFAQGPLLVLPPSHGDGGTALLPGSYAPDLLRELGPALSGAAQAPVLAGYAPAAGREAIPAAARRAAAVLRTVRATERPPGVYGLSDVLLDYHLAQPRDGDEDVAALLGPLAPHPEVRRTLAVYLAADRDRRCTATALGVHPNTVDNRIARAGALTGVDPHSTAGIVLLSAALAVTDEP